MVLSGKARYNSSIVNRTNTCGGHKKAGRGAVIGWNLNIGRHGISRAPQSVPTLCIPFISHSVQSTRVRHGIGMG